MIFQDTFTISQRIFPSNRPIELDIRGIVMHLKTESLRQRYGDFSLLWVREDGTFTDGSIPGWNRFEGPVPAQYLDDGTMRFTIPAQAEGGISCRLRLEGAKGDICSFSIYVLDDDLYGLEPLRGDMHVHSSFSECGNSSDDPLNVAGQAMKHGLDFIALTDHIQIEGSEFLISELDKYYQGGFRVYPGEECHLLDSHLETRFCHNKFFPWLHIVSFGANDGVIRYANDHYDEFLDDLSRRMAELDPGLHESVRRAMAGSDWLIDTIHRFGGLAIYAHPFWKPNFRFNLPAPVREYILAQGKFDAIELPGLGTNSNRQYREGNELCQAWWVEASIKAGRILPVVGDTDSHDSNTLLGRQYTIVWAKENSLEALKEAIRNGRTATVSFYEDDVAPHFCGASRLVTLACFLVREIFPLQQEERKLEGLELLRKLRAR